MDLPLLDLDDDRPDADADSHTAAGLERADRGDWHGAAESFEAALAAHGGGGGTGGATESRATDVALAVALTNLGQARAQLGALNEAAALLERSVVVRTRLVAAGGAGAAVVVRGLVDLAAVRAAAGDPRGAREALRRAEEALPDGHDGLRATLAEGLSLLGRAA